MVLAQVYLLIFQHTWDNTMRHMKIFALLAVLVAFFSNAHAAPVGFNGFYDYSTWTSAETYGGTTVSSVDGSQQTLTLMEPDSFPFTPWAPQEFTFSHVVSEAGTVSFDWAFNAEVDACCSGLNFYVNGTLYTLTGGNFADPYRWDGMFTSGTFSIGVNAGDTIKFAAFSADSCCGATTNTISNFEAPASNVPEPQTLALLGMGAMGFVASRRKKAKN